MLIPTKYISIKNRYKTKKGLSERIVKRLLEKSGWKVWRAGSLCVLEREDVYPNVLLKYRELENLIDAHIFQELKYISSVHHGMPDFICYNTHKKKNKIC